MEGRSWEQVPRRGSESSTGGHLYSWDEAPKVAVPTLLPAVLSLTPPASVRAGARALTE